jgi:hypothetical protein
MRSNPAALSGMILGLLVAASAIAADEPVDTETPDPLVARIEKAVDRYQVRWIATGEDLSSTTVMRWRNDPRGQEGIALMVLWTHQGRPAALASLYPWQKDLVHEFGSLSPAEAVGAFDGERTVWSPKTEGVQWQTIADAPAPAETPVARLRQMKQLAERFEAVMTGWKGDNSDRETLRLLPKELYRYAAANLDQAGSTVTDGAVFAFVQGTDPEVILLLQSESIDGTSMWRYALSRATSGGLEVKLDKQIAWTAERNYHLNDRDGDVFTIGESIGVAAAQQ